MRMVKDYPSGWLLGLGGAILVMVVVKIGLLSAGVVPFNSDEAIVALMARHILQGELPLFFYGQAYMGSLDAFLVAGIYKLFGETVWGIRILQIILYSFTIITSAVIGKRITGSWRVGVLAAWLLAIPTVNMTLYTTVSLGGYGEMLLIGNLILLTTLQITRDLTRSEGNNRLWLWFCFGFLSGFGLWVFGLSLVYSIPALIYLVWYLIRIRIGSQIDNISPIFWCKSKFTLKVQKPLVNTGFIGVIILGGIFGSLPWWASTHQSGLSNLIIELGGSAIAGVEGLTFLEGIVHHGVNLGLFGSTVVLGMRPPWEIRWFALPLAPLVLIFWAAVMVFLIPKVFKDLKISPYNPNNSHTPLLGGVAIMVLAGFIFTPFGADPSGRYFLPLGVVMSLIAAQAALKWIARWSSKVWIVIGLVLAFNLWGTLQAATNFPPGFTTQIDSVAQIDHRHDDELIQFLRSQGEFHGYTNYWVAYPLAFLTAEEMVFLPMLPYHQDFRYTSRDNRYPVYENRVREAEQIAYITTNNKPLDKLLESGFDNLGVTWQENSIGDFHVYYGLSRPVTPEEIGLGGNN